MLHMCMSEIKVIDDIITVCRDVFYLMHDIFAVIYVITNILRRFLFFAQ